ncbi:MAG: sigma 54-interacting transcriptional regulator [Gemmatimonadaceae bacterium]|nr:sigma 54-interacting transcriptional regulator [Gemmatimonadaceae bacterium]
MPRRVAFGILGLRLDSAPPTGDRWLHWRPTVDLVRHEDLLLDRFEILHHRGEERLLATVSEDLRSVSPETEVRGHLLPYRDPWDFEAVYGALHDFAGAYAFDLEEEEYLVHITTGTHVEQICLFLLTESRHLPGRLLQASPPPRARPNHLGRFSIIDLDLSRYDRLASRFREERQDAVSFLKSGIETRNPAFNALIDEIERVAIASRAPLLLTGPTGAGKSRLARRLFDLKRSRKQTSGAFVELNCATLRGDAAMSALFGHVKGAFTGALSDRAGLLRAADGGILFLDEIGELGLDEQAMLLRALEDRVFLPVGSDREVRSDFQLLAGTNRDLARAVREGRFREDLLSRINLWAFRLPSLRERPEDIEPNLDFELAEHTRATGNRVSFNREAREAFLRFATSPEAAWPANFRDFNAAILRMATLAHGGRINVEAVLRETERLRAAWGSPAPEAEGEEDLAGLLPSDRLSALDLFDRVQLAAVVRICRESRTLSDAGRTLFAASRSRKFSVNDADRLRKYLGRFGLEWTDVGR